MASGSEASSEPSQGDRRLSEIPCFRQTFLYSIGSGLAVGLGTFMFTSRPRLASHVAVGTYCGVTMTYWVYCRYTWRLANTRYRQLQRAVSERALREGTAGGTEGSSVADAATLANTKPEVADA